MILTFDGEYIFRKFKLRREDIVIITIYTERVIPISSRIDTTVASQSSYMKVFASSGSFQDVCGELIGVGLFRDVLYL